MQAVLDVVACGSVCTDGSPREAVHLDGGRVANATADGRRLNARAGRRDTTAAGRRARDRVADRQLFSRDYLYFHDGGGGGRQANRTRIGKMTAAVV